MFNVPVFLDINEDNVLKERIFPMTLTRPLSSPKVNRGSCGMNHVSKIVFNVLASLDITKDRVLNGNIKKDVPYDP